MEPTSTRRNVGETLNFHIGPVYGPGHFFTIPENYNVTVAYTFDLIINDCNTAFVRCKPFLIMGFKYQKNAIFWYDLHFIKIYIFERRQDTKSKLKQEVKLFQSYNW